MSFILMTPSPYRMVPALTYLPNTMKVIEHRLEHMYTHTTEAPPGAPQTPDHEIASSSGPYGGYS